MMMTIENTTITFTLIVLATAFNGILAVHPLHLNQ